MQITTIKFLEIQTNLWIDWIMMRDYIVQGLQVFFQCTKQSALSVDTDKIVNLAQHPKCFGTVGVEFYCC